MVEHQLNGNQTIHLTCCVHRVHFTLIIPFEWRLFPNYRSFKGAIYDKLIAQARFFNENLTQA